MRILALAVLLCAGGALGFGVPARPSGYSLLAPRRGVRVEALQHAGTRGAELITNPQFQSALKSCWLSAPGPPRHGGTRNRLARGKV
jgi:hypothetical protein